jgi:hypothetical protein
MVKRKFRIVKRENNVPVLGVCEYDISHGRKKEDARGNQYRVNTKLALRHPIEQHRSVAALLELGMPGGKGR